MRRKVEAIPSLRDKKCYNNTMDNIDYISDDEHEDKWNNLEKACWSGYKQVGMKDKNGKQVPNCVPINKATGLPEEPKPSWNGVFKPKK